MAYRRPFSGWMLLDRFVRRRDDDTFPADNPTTASLTNSRGDEFDICLNLKKPPQPSSVYVRWPNGPTEGEPLDAAAAHGGAVLLLMHYIIPVRGGLPFPMIDYIVYNPTGPSLRLLPSLLGTIDEVLARAEAENLHISKNLARRMESRDVGIIQRGPGDFAVAELQIAADRETTPWPEVRVFIPSVSQQWFLKTPRVVPVHPRDDLDMDRILWYWDTDAVVPFGTWLCWVDYTAGILLCNVFDECSEILFLELPVKLPCINRDEVGRGWLEAYHTLGVTKGGHVLKFTRVLADDVPSLTRWHYQTGNNMVWQEESAVTADQLRDLDEFDHLPRELLMYPTFSLNNTDVVCFVLKKEDGTYDVGEIWLVAVNMKKKIVRSSILYIKDYDDCSPEEAELFERKMRYFEPFIPVEFSKNMNMGETSTCYQGFTSGWHASKRKYRQAEVAQRENLDVCSPLY